MSLTIELQLTCVQYQKRFCNICQVRFDEKTLHSSHCSCPGRVCEPCRVEQLFGEIERHETVIGKCSFCRVQMGSLPKVPSNWSSWLNVHGPDGIHQWNELGELFRQVGNPVRTIFSWNGRQTWAYNSFHWRQFSVARQRIVGDRTPLEIGRKVHGGRAISSRLLGGKHYGNWRALSRWS